MAMGEEKTMGRKVQRTLGESVTTKIKPTSVRKTGTPMALKLSAMVWSVMVLPVPVAPVMSPCLFAMRASMHSLRSSGVRDAGFSAAAMKSRLSEVSIVGPLRAEPGGGAEKDSFPFSGPADETIRLFLKKAKGRGGVVRTAQD